MTERDSQPPTFENALGELQTIVQQLEEGAVGLEDSLRRFERGMELLRHCHQLLEQVEQRIGVVTGMTAEGEPIVEPFVAEDVPQPPAERRRRRRPADGGSTDETLF